MAKANKINTLYVYSVSGTGVFPFDMLRHDRCWVEKETDAGKLDSPRRGSDILRTVGVIGLQPPTPERWKSFGWNVDGIARTRVIA